MSGHLIPNPAGEEIRLPSHAINTFKLLKVTVFNRKRRLRQITEAIFPLLKREYDTITSGPEIYNLQRSAAGARARLLRPGMVPM